MTLPEEKAPFTEPYGMADTDFKSKGNTALAVKRAMAHLGFLKWEPDQWDNQWNKNVNEASAAWKKKRGLIPADSHDGSWGKKAHDTMRGTWFEKDGQHLDAFDGESQRLLQEEKAQSGSDDKISKVRKAITSFCEQGIGEPDWYYSQARAIAKSINPNGPATSDCSGSVIQIFWYAKQQTGVNVPDPAMQNWSGHGNTSYYEDDWPKVTDGKFQVGDLAHYDGHVCCCYHPGDKDSADWWSFGSEPPSKRKLHYRTDFRFVVRPKLVA